jgi:serine/threonine-protein kinase
MIALLCALLGGLASWWIQRSPSARNEVLRLSIQGPGESGLRSFLLSPTGDRIVYRTPSGLVVRELDKPEGRVIPGTARASSPFFSPDGRWLGFTESAESSLKKVPLTGGAPMTLCKGIESSPGATWGPDDTIVFTPNYYSGLWQVAAAGGDPRELTKPDRARGEKSHRWPHFLPGGKAVLFTVGTSRLTRWDDARIDVLRLPNGERHTILEGGTAATYVESGHLAYRRGTSILAAPFDLDRLATTGPPVAVVDGVQSASLDGSPSFTVARTGMLAYVPHTRSAQRLVLVNRAGEARPLTPWAEPVARIFDPRVSPDGRVIALTMEAANDQVWRFDIEREALSQVTFEWDNHQPVWTPDGEFLIVSSTPGWKLHRLRADGSGTPEPLLMASRNTGPDFVTADGKLLVYSEGGTFDIWVLPLERDGEPRVFLQTPAFEGLSAISPSGRFVAYQSNESGTMEVYLRSFPDAGSKVQVSSGGGFRPAWARSGRELFYRVPLEGSRWRMMVADVSQEDRIRVSRSRRLFEDSYVDGGYDVLPDGQHFVMIQNEHEASQVTHLNVILNWFEELRRLVPPK